ncbi:MAG TPA: tetratricopeptide repeat protein, partial [Polyangia bacterium]|nr:tetratricopeptide repeat protein [Polyangia bacterium]
MTPTRSLAALALVAALAAAARGDGNQERARAHFEAGRVQYNLGDYPAAAREFAAGYRAVPRPQFLVNLGQTYRRMGQLERAREMYERFLADAPPNDRARPQVRELVGEVERELARTRAAAAKRRTGTEPPDESARDESARDESSRDETSPRANGAP